MADIGGLAVAVALDIVEIADPVERLAGDLGFGRGPEVMEVAPQMRLAGRLAQTLRAIGFMRAMVTLARFIAVILHRRWKDDPDFHFHSSALDVR